MFAVTDTSLETMRSEVQRNNWFMVEPCWDRWEGNVGYWLPHTDVETKSVVIVSETSPCDMYNLLVVGGDPVSFMLKRNIHPYVLSYRHQKRSGYLFIINDDNSLLQMQLRFGGEFVHRLLKANHQ